MSFVFCSARRRIILLAALLLTPQIAAAAPPPPMPALFPEKAIAFAEINGLDSKLEQLRTSDLLASWFRSPQYQRYAASSDYRKLTAALQIVERQLGWDAWTTAKKLFGGRVAVGVYPKEGSERPDVLIIIRPPEPTVLADLRQRLDPILVLAEEQIPRTETLDGLEILSFLGDAVVAAHGDDWLAVSTKRTLLDEAVRRLTGEPEGESSAGLAESTSYQTMATSVAWDRPDNGPDEEQILRVFVDTGLLNKSTGGRPLPEKLDNPLGSLLFGDVVESLRTSPFAAATVDASANGLLITAAVARDAEKLDGAHEAFVPAEGQGVLPPPRVPNLMGAFSLYRDFAHWYTHREELLQDQVLPGFDKFETGLANILPGRDFGQDVLPLIGKRITFVAAPQDYAHLDGTPGVKLPGMAVIVELARPDEAASLLQLFFQTLAAILNLEAGQQGRQPWVVASEAYRDVQVSYARYLQKPAGENLGIVYNFLPASARVGDRFILSSSLPLCKQLIDSLHEANGSTEIAATPHTMRGELRFDSLTSLIESDADFFVGRMAQEGRTTEEARAEFAALLDLLRGFNSLKATTEVLPNVFQLRLEGSWK